MFMFHHGPAGHTGHMEMYSVIQAVTQRKSFWYMKYIKIVIEGTEILAQCLNHGGSYRGSLMVMILM